MIKAVIVKPNQVPKLVDIEDDLRVYQNIVDGYIMPISIGNEITALVNEEGRLLGMSPNFAIGYTTILGPAVIVRDRGDIYYESLTENQINETYRIIKEGRL